MEQTGYVVEIKMALQKLELTVNLPAEENVSAVKDALQMLLL